MYFYFLIEDRSTEELIHALMAKFTAGRTDLFYDCKSFHGIGGYSKKRTPQEIKTGKLLNDLSIYLRGFDKTLQSMKKDAAVVVVLDNDNRNPDEFRSELKSIAAQQMKIVDHVICLAVEEMEAWLLGDWEAVKAAYPHARDAVFRSYQQDSICGTCEILADVVYPGGMKKFRKDCSSYADIGAKKIEWARKIGSYMEPDRNLSPSFQFFLSEITKRLPDITSE